MNKELLSCKSKEVEGQKHESHISKIIRVIKGREKVAAYKFFHIENFSLNYRFPRKIHGNIFDIWKRQMTKSLSCLEGNNIASTYMNINKKKG